MEAPCPIRDEAKFEDQEGGLGPIRVESAMYRLGDAALDQEATDRRTEEACRLGDGSMAGPAEWDAQPELTSCVGHRLQLNFEIRIFRHDSLVYRFLVGKGFSV